MPLRCYKSTRFSEDRMDIIRKANSLIKSYQGQGYTLTLRQLYYRFIAADWFPSSWADPATGSTNNEKSYKKLGDVISDARMAGLIDWEAIEDRTREVAGTSHWDTPADIIQTCARSFRLDKWTDQEYRVECLPPDQLVRTQQGYVPIVDIAVGDMVLTHVGRWQLVTEVKSHWHQGEMLTVKAVGCLPVKMTPNHPIWGRLRDQSKPGYKGAARKYLDDFDFHRADMFGGLDQVFVPVPVARCPVDGVEMTTPFGKGKVVNAPWNLSLRRMIGLYLAEGRVREDERTVQFTLGESELHHRDVITTWAAEVGLSTHEVVGNGARQVYVYSRALTGWLESNFGSGAYNKKVPIWLLHAPDDEQMDVVEYYFRGDGSVEQATSSYRTTSRSLELIHSMRSMLVRSGIVAGISQIEDHGAPRYSVQVAGAAMDKLQQRWKWVKAPAKGLGRSCRYNLSSVIPTGMTTLIAQVTSEPYEGLVYNIEVAKDHSYVAEIAVHNCWVEKDALEGIVAKAANAYDVQYFSCRGYASATSIWDAGQRLKEYVRGGQKPVILHLGDHDPSGIDMSRDIEARVSLFMDGNGDDLTFKRIALNMNQVQQYNPPPNPAKVTDSRFKLYMLMHGSDCWELDALDPVVIDQLIRDEIDKFRDVPLYEQREQEEEEHRQDLAAAAKHWEAHVAPFVKGI